MSQDQPDTVLEVFEAALGKLKTEFPNEDFSQIDATIEPLRARGGSSVEGISATGTATAPSGETVTNEA